MSEKRIKRSDLLVNKHKNGYDRISEAERSEMNEYCEAYKSFLNKCKTERECVRETLKMLNEHGYHQLVRGESLKAGDKVYRVIANKSLVFAVIGEDSMDKGTVIVGGHIDSPRLDLKPNPLYEDNGFALMKTHYYGGIRKYQWVSIPLALHGVICYKDGRSVPVAIGEDIDDPVIAIPDLLPHLGYKQAQEPLQIAIKGENLNLMVGSEPYPDEEEKERCKLKILDILYEKYGIVEEDLTSAELHAVPAFRASDVGLDRSMIGSYGQDDRVCSYAALKALLDCESTLKRTGICILTDKEEIGSYGITGVDSSYFDVFLSDLCDGTATNYKTCIENSFCLSCDVAAAFDPNYSEVFDKYNSGRANEGISIFKYTGKSGKSGASDATGELVAYARNILDNDGVIWHICELGKVDEGGGGTIAHYMARRGIPTLDAGTAVLAMHSPFEVTSKLDCYMTYRAAKAFFNH